MASSQNTINLIRTKTSSSPQLEAIEASLKKTGYVGLIGFLSVSFVLVVVYLFFFQEKNRLQTIHESLTNQLIANSQKEAMYVSIKDRTNIVSKALTSQRPWTQLLDQITSFVQPPTLSDISVDDQGKITMSIKADSVDSMLQVINGIIAETQNNEIVNPQLVSFQLGKNDSIQSTISFFGVF